MHSWLHSVMLGHVEWINQISTLHQRLGTVAVFARMHGKSVAILFWFFSGPRMSGDM